VGCYKRLRARIHDGLILETDLVDVAKRTAQVEPACAIAGCHDATHIKVLATAKGEAYIYVTEVDRPVGHAEAHLTKERWAWDADDIHVTGICGDAGPQKGVGRGGHGNTCGKGNNGECFESQFHNISFGLKKLSSKFVST
jgi:hypothetical protein